MENDEVGKPEIRFKGFSNAWELHTYEDIGQCFSGGNLSYDSLSSEGKNKCVLYGELYTTYDCIIKDVVNRTNFVGNTIYKNDILFPQSTTVDANSLISPACLNDEKAETSGVFVIRPKENIDGNFVCYYSKGNTKQRAKLAKKAQGLTIVHLYYQSIKDEQIFIPSYKEQEKISKLLTNLDSLITLHQHKRDKLKNIKKSLLEKMFPAEGCDVPQIRFKEFTCSSADMLASSQRQDSSAWAGDKPSPALAGIPNPCESAYAFQPHGRGCSADSLAISHFTEKSLPATDKVSRQQNFSSEKCDLAHEPQSHGDSNQPYFEKNFIPSGNEWIRVKLGDIVKIIKNNTLSRDDLTIEKQEYKNIHYGDILVKFKEYINAVSDVLPYIKDNIDYHNLLLKDGDIVFSDTAEDETVGKCCEVRNIGNQKIVSGLHTIPVRPNIKFANYYLGFYLNSSKFHNQLLPLMQGIKVTSISKLALLENTFICYPDNYFEQQKIGKLFSSLDNLITLHDKKVTKLKQIKQALLNKMFV